jgi:RNA polymerase primary sigma factor
MNTRMLDDAEPVSRHAAIDLARRARAGDTAAMQALVVSNLRYARKIAARWARHATAAGLDIDDLTSIAVEGMIHATTLFDPDRGTSFLTYATPWMVQRIQHAIGNGAGPLRCPRNRPRSDWARGVSLAQPVGRDDDGDCATLGDVLADTNAPCPVAGALAATDVDRVWAALSLLSARDQHLLRLRFGLREDGAGMPAMLEELGTIFRVSRERARQLERRALARLRRRLVRVGLPGGPNG